VPNVDVDGLSMYYEEHGDGPWLVLILGLAGDVEEFGELIGSLAGHHRVLAFDNRGGGRTGKPDSPYTIGMMAEDTAGLMRAVGIERADVLGISLGGRIAMELAVRHPHRVHRLVLVSTAARVINSRRRRLVLGLLSRVLPYRGPRRQPRYAFEHQRDASTRYDGRGRLPEIHQPTLILHGRRDSSAPYPLAEELHAGIAGSTFVSFDGGHLFLVKGEKQPFHDEVAKFLT
jgi:pimeloyl-ACP methyl ester carboxylesterase